MVYSSNRAKGFFSMKSRAWRLHGGCCGGTAQRLKRKPTVTMRTVRKNKERFGELNGRQDDLMSMSPARMMAGGTL